jgi:hypothetical protein
LRLPLAATVVLALLAPQPASAQGLPPTLQAFADEQAAACRGAGGEPRIGPAFATAVDLDGDGRLDYIVDLAGIECAGAWSFFCGSAGCPVSVWLAGPDGHDRVWGDYAQGWEIVGSGSETALVVHQHGTACPENATGVEPCSQRLAFAVGGVAAEAGPRAPAASPAVSLPQPETAGWTLRAVPDGDPVAVAAGPGLAERLAVFCLGGRPWLAVSLAGGPGPETLAVDFAFERAAAEAGGEARREEGAGGAYVLDLSDGVLAGLLAGRDSEAAMAIAGTDQGVLSLQGSTRAIRAALAPCLAL